MRNSKAKTDTKPKAADVEKSLEAIYEEDGKLPDLATIEPHRRPYLLLIIAGLVTFVCILLTAIWVGFLLFKPFRGFSGDGLRITIDGPDKISLGEENTYFINWQNLSNGPLAAADLRINFPSDFAVVGVDPAPTMEGQLIYPLGSVPYGGHGTIRVRGMFTGALGTKTVIQVVGNYRPASFNSDFEALTTRPIEYADSVIEGRLDVPVKALPGDRVSFVYTVLNHGSVPMKGLESRITIPTGFVHDATSTAGYFEGDVLRVPLPELAPQTSSTIVLRGTFATGFSGDAVLHAQTGKLSESGVFLPTQKSEANLSVLAGDLTLKLLVNGADTDRSVPYGEVQHVSLAYENTSPEELKDVSLRLFIEPVATGTVVGRTLPSPVDWSRLEQSSSGTYSGSSIVWDKRSSPSFEKLVPQQDGILEFSVPALSISMLNSSSTVIPTGTRMLGYHLIAEAQMTIGNTKIVRTIRTKPMGFRFRSDVKLTSEARYTSEEGAPVGSGPLPPTVGQATQYRIEWVLGKSVHELKNIRVSADLPRRVEWVGVATTTAGELKYDSEKRVVTWTLNRMPTDINEEFVGFDVKFVPEEVDVGRFGQLLGEARFEATDVDIDEPLVSLSPRLSTDLPDDETAKSKGVVKKP